MTTFVPEAVQKALDAARLEGRRKNRLRVQAGDWEVPVLRMWKTGFSVAESEVPHLRGLVDLYDGARHLSQCLIVATGAAGGEMRYEFKRATLAADKAPLDFYRDPGAPVALIQYDGLQGEA